MGDLRVFVAAVDAVGVAVAHPPLVDAPRAAPVVVLLALELALGVALTLLCKQGLLIWPLSCKDVIHIVKLEESSFGLGEDHSLFCYIAFTLPKQKKIATVRKFVRC